MTVADFLVELGEKTIKRIKRFSRKKTKRQQLEDAASWTKPDGSPRMHIPTMNQECVVCGELNAKDTDRCPGDPITQRARLKLKEEP